MLAFLSRERFHALYDATSRPDVAEGAQYVAITSVDNASGSPVGYIVRITDGCIVSMSVSCGPVPPDEFISQLGLTEPIIAAPPP